MKLPAPYDKLKIGDYITVYSLEVLKENVPAYVFTSIWESEKEDNEIVGTTHKIKEFMNTKRELEAGYKDSFLTSDGYTLSHMECYPTKRLQLKGIYDA